MPPNVPGLDDFDKFHVATVQKHFVDRSHVEKRGRKGNVNWSNQPLDTVLALHITSYHYKSCTTDATTHQRHRGLMLRGCANGCSSAPDMGCSEFNLTHQFGECCLSLHLTCRSRASEGEHAGQRRNHWRSGEAAAERAGGSRTAIGQAAGRPASEGACSRKTPIRSAWRAAAGPAPPEHAVAVHSTRAAVRGPPPESPHFLALMQGTVPNKAAVQPGSNVGIRLHLRAGPIPIAANIASFSRSHGLHSMHGHKPRHRDVAKLLQLYHPTQQLMKDGQSRRADTKE